MSWLATIGGILMIGHSLFGQTNPDMLKSALRSQGSDAVVEAQIINGAPLSYNWDNSASAEGVDARAVLPKGEFDVVILTEAIPLANHVKWSDSTGAALKFFEAAQSARPGTRVYLQETWHSLNSGTGAEVPYDENAHIPWRDRLDQDLPVWQGIVDEVNDARPSGSPDMQLLPAGQAMARLHDEIAAGTVPGLGDIGQVFADDIHLNEIGFYFVTMVQFAVLTGQSPVGLPPQLSDRWGKPFRAPPDALATRLQEIAWRVAQGVQLNGPGPVSVEKPNTSDPAPKSVEAPAQPQPAEQAKEPQTTVSEPAPTVKAPDHPVPVAVGLAGVNDWGSQQPFLNVMKTARPWIGHRPRQWGGASFEELAAAGYLDEQGWPLAIPPELGSVGTMILTDLPEEASSLAGRYRLRFEGKGVIEATGRASNVRYGKNEVQFDFTPGPGSVDIRIQRSSLSNPVRNISVVHLDHVAAFDSGEVFNPNWLELMRGFAGLRFMDWMETNNSKQSTWANRPKPDDFTWAHKGTPIETMVALANEVDSDMWVNIPHLADDGMVTNLATYVRDTLSPDRKAYVEFSNEVWNWQFEQARWADEAAIERWGMNDAWVQFYAARAVEVADIWAEVFAENRDRLVNVISTQTGWIGLEEMILEAPLWVEEKAGRDVPASHFDAYAITGYIAGHLGTDEMSEIVDGWLSESRMIAEDDARHANLSGAEFDDYVAAHKFDLASALAWSEVRHGSESGNPAYAMTSFLDEMLPYHAAVAERYGLDLVMYEGGTHAVGIGPRVDDEDLTEFLIHFNYTEEMGSLYSELIAGWDAAGGKLFNAYADVYAPTKWGSWGTRRYLTDDNPRWRAVAAFK